MTGFTKSEYLIFLLLTCTFIVGFIVEQNRLFDRPVKHDPKQSEKLTAFESAWKQRHQALKVKQVPVKPDASIRIININTAQKEDWEQLPQIGPTLAQRIIEYRSVNGPFSVIEQLLDVKGIGIKKLDLIRPYLVLSK
jgi:competence ComEA-like helix-hairpin-helix protein